MPPITYTARFTGWQLVFGLRTDLFRNGYEQQRTLGCLDAPTSFPAGSVVGIQDNHFPPARYARESNQLRD